MTANRIKPVLAALAVFCTLAAIPEADAGDRPDRRQDHRWADRGHGYHRVENNRFDRQGDGRRNRPAEIDRIASSRTGSSENEPAAENFNAYGGSITPYVFGRNGIYFDRDYWAEPLGKPEMVLAPKAKIIHIGKGYQSTAFDAVSACEYEVGVCVIRGGN